MEANSNDVALNTIAEIIKKKVDNRLEKEIRVLLEVLNPYTNKLSEDVKITIPGIPNSIPFRSAAWNASSPFFEYLRNSLRDRYTKEETQEFVREVEELKQRITDLENGKSYE